MASSPRRKRRQPKKKADDFDAKEFARTSAPAPIDPGKLRRVLRRQALSLEGIADRFEATKGAAVDALDALRASGANLQEFGETFSIEKDPRPVEHDPDRHHLTSDPRGWHRVGLVADTHIGSKYAREDVIEELYDWFAAEGIERVYHAGNWIDGEFRFNKYDLLPEAHGMQAQLDLFVARYPKRPGIRTFYVAGDDHEGWYSQREGVDIGRMLEDTAHRAGRHDLVYLGYKEAFITLEHKRTKKHARMLVDHPGGGTAYALSYSAQKRVEAAQPGEKPAVWCFGHWHKHGYFVIRGVHVVLVPCTKDLDPFGRKKGLEYTIGGAILEMRQDEGGAIEEVVPRFRLYFDRGYYNDQFNPAGPIGRRGA